MPPNTPQNVDQESSHHNKQSLKSRKINPLITSFQKLFRGKLRSKPHSQSVTPQYGSADISLYREIEHPDHVSQSLSSNSRTIEQNLGATLQDAHHFSISGNARIVNIGQQNVNNRGTSGLDTLEKFVSFSALHDSSAQDPERCCHPGTRQSVLHQMRIWMDDPSARERILWLHGPAGVGKSAIAQTISNSYNQDKVGATFFFFRSDPIRNDGNRLVPTLAWQLASSVPIVNDLIAFALEKHSDIPRKAIEVQFNKLITQPFLTISGDESTSPMSIRVIIIDGLDECSDVKLQQRVLKLIGNAVSDPYFPLRFIISSRPEAYIEDFFAQFQHPTLQIDLANVDAAYRDIKTYLTSEFARIAIEQDLDPRVWPAPDIIDILVFKSSGQFVYASTVIKYIGAEYESAVEQLKIVLGLKPTTGESPFSELDALYTEILQRQPDKNFLKEFLSVLVARSMLPSYKYHDLHEDDAMLLGIDNKQLHRKLQGMHSLLKSKPFIDVHHKSFLDFLDDPSRSGEYHIGKHFANRRYMQLITDKLIKAASNAIEQPDSHEGDHFTPSFVHITNSRRLAIELPLEDLEDILRPLSIIQEKLLQLPHISDPRYPRACHKCRTFYMIDDLLLHLALFRGTVQLQKPMHVGIRPLTTTEEKQCIPQLDLDSCLSLLLANLRGVEVSLNVDTIGLVRALTHFDPIETAMKIRSIADAQNLVDLIFCLKKKECFKSWFGAAAHNATRLAIAIYGRVPVLPQSLFLNSADLDRDEYTYQGKVIYISNGNSPLQLECFDAFIYGNLSHENIMPLLGICYDSLIWPLPANGTLKAFLKSINFSVSQLHRIIFEVAKAIQYMHSLDFVISLFSEDNVYLDSDNHAKVNLYPIRPNWLSDGWLKYADYDVSGTLEDNVRSFGLLFHEALGGQFYVYDDKVTFKIRPQEPETPENVWELIQWCCAEDPKERPTMDQVVQEMKSWISLGQCTLLS